MKLEEKVRLLYGASYMDLHDVQRLGIPSLKTADGPLGIRWLKSTAFPCPLAMAATWDVELVERVGVAFGREWRNKGRQVWLGPCVNIVRIPHGGRNFETYGEDPYLNARMAVAAIRGAQSQRVIACVKHFACNNQEHDRFQINIEVDERTLHEIYLPAFKAAVQEGQAWSVMAAYNRLNGHYCSANALLLDDILKKQWGFDGFVVSDWGAVHDTVGPARAGLDLEMDLHDPVGKYWGHGKLLQACREGEVSETLIDDKVRRLLRAMFFTGIMDKAWSAPDRPMTEHWPLAREVAASGMVLLKNKDALLPLDPNRKQVIAVLGPNSRDMRLGGGGSSVVTPRRSVGPLEGIGHVIGPEVQVVAEVGVIGEVSLPVAVDSSWLRPPTGDGHGLVGEYFDNPSLDGEPVFTRVDPSIAFEWKSGSPDPRLPSDGFSVRWRGTLTSPRTGEFQLGVASDDGVRMYLDGELLFEDWFDRAVKLSSETVRLEAGKPRSLVIEYYESAGYATAILSCFKGGHTMDAALDAARRADAALVLVGLSSTVETEGSDRASMEMDAEQVDLIRRVAGVNPRTIVVVIAGSQVGMASWIDDVEAVIQAWYPGQEGGDAIANVLFGKVNPSGKLPMTFVREWDDHPAFHNYPGGRYTEGLYVGYRHYDKHGVEPLFPFGHGLSYSSFKYSDLAVTTRDAAQGGPVRVTLDVRNVGQRSGAEIVQLYVRDVASRVDRPVKELKRFAKIDLASGELQRVHFDLRHEDFAFYDPVLHQWRVEPGEFEVLVGSSSRDIRLRQVFEYSYAPDADAEMHSVPGAD